MIGMGLTEMHDLRRPIGSAKHTSVESCGMCRFGMYTTGQDYATTEDRLARPGTACWRASRTMKSVGSPDRRKPRANNGVSSATAQKTTGEEWRKLRDLKCWENRYDVCVEALEKGSTTQIGGVSGFAMRRRVVFQGNQVRDQHLHMLRSRSSGAQPRPCQRQRSWTRSPRAPGMLENIRAYSVPRRRRNSVVTKRGLRCRPTDGCRHGRG